MQIYDIILFAAIAVFLILKLRSVLGRRDGHGGPSTFEGFNRPQRGQGGDKVINLPERASPPGGQAGEEQPAPAPERPDFGTGPAAEGMKAINAEDAAFEPKSFLEGARMAFDMIITAFARGDAKALRPLLADEVYADFAGAIDGRAKAGEALDSQLIGIGAVEIIEAELQGKTAFVTVKFVSEQINVVKDKEDRIVEGDPNEVVKITDLWTFARNVKSRDPNWKLVATQTPN